MSSGPRLLCTFLRKTKLESLSNEAHFSETSYLLYSSFCNYDICTDKDGTYIDKDHNELSTD